MASQIEDIVRRLNQCRGGLREAGHAVHLCVRAPNAPDGKAARDVGHLRNAPPRACSAGGGLNELPVQSGPCLPVHPSSVWWNCPSRCSSDSATFSAAQVCRRWGEGKPGP
jgi:hypothetical protein